MEFAHALEDGLAGLNIGSWSAFDFGSIAISTSHSGIRPSGETIASSALLPLDYFE